MQQEQQTRRIEALSRLDEPERALLLEMMPEWIDRDDPVEVEAFKKARAEAISPRSSE